jgi:sigma-E factor negative regulatory protein RseA
MKYFETENLSMAEQLSALHDGQLDAAQAAALVRASLADDHLMQQWRSMSAISHVMRHESSQPAWQAMQSVPIQTAQHAGSPAAQVAANDSRWKMVAGFAALAAVGSLIWGLLGAGGSGSPAGAVLASNQPAPTQPAAILVSASTGQATTQIAGQEAMMIRNPRLDEFLAAHKQFGSVSALQQPAGSLRSVSVVTQRSASLATPIP